jgi:hypothetical protein
VYDDSQDSLFVYGGFDLNYILGDLLVYRFQEAKWNLFDFDRSKFVSMKVST